MSNENSTTKLSEVEDGGAFRWSPEGPAWRRLGPIVREVDNIAHTISIPNWEALVWPEGAKTYGACGVEGCNDCLPTFDANNQEV